MPVHEISGMFGIPDSARPDPASARKGELVAVAGARGRVTVFFIGRAPLVSLTVGPLIFAAIRPGTNQ